MKPHERNVRARINLSDAFFLWDRYVLGPRAEEKGLAPDLRVFELLGALAKYDNIDLITVALLRQSADAPTMRENSREDFEPHIRGAFDALTPLDQEPWGEYLDRVCRNTLASTVLLEDLVLRLRSPELRESLRVRYSAARDRLVRNLRLENKYGLPLERGAS